MKNLLTGLVVILYSITVSFILDKPLKLSSFPIEEVLYQELDTIVVRPNYHHDSIEFLTRLVFSEASLESLEGKIAIVNVIQNRSLKTGRSIIQVVERRGQFDGRWTEQFYSKSAVECNSCKIAVKMALNGYKVIPKTVTYYHNTCISTDKKWIKYIEDYVYKRIDNHVFCYHPDLISKEEKELHGYTYLKKE